MGKRVKTILILMMIAAPMLYGLHRVTGPIQDLSGRWTGGLLFYSVADDTNDVVAMETLDDLTDFVAGTTSQVTVTDDGDGTITLSGPQDLATTSSPTFAGLTSAGTIEAGTLTEGGVGVYNQTESDAAYEAELNNSAGLMAALDDETGTGLAVFGTGPTFTTQITITPEANPTTDADGELAVDTDGWGSGYDAIEFFNGTASAYLVATTASDAPSNGQVPKWNTGGTITWENDADTGGATAYNSIGDPTGAGSISFDDTETATYVTATTATDFMHVNATGAFGDISIFKVTQDTGNPTDGALAEFSTADAEDNVDQLLLGNGADDYVTFRILEAGTFTIDVTSDGTAAVVIPDPITANGGLTSSGTIEAGTLTEGGDAVYAADEIETALGVGGSDTLFPADPDADRVLMWDDDPGALVWSAAGSGDMLADGSVPFASYVDVHATGVRITGSADGDITLLGLGDGFDEDLNLNLDDTENTAVVSSTTGVTGITFTGIALTANLTGNVTGDVSGNAGTVTNGVYTGDAGTVFLAPNGDGSSLTSVDAATGDSATAFFDAGTIEHERGGLQADVSAYTGLIAITGADTTAEIDSKSELEGQIADVADFAEADGDIYTNNHDFGGADLELPQASPAVPDADGEVELDFTDGKLVVQHGSAHAELAAATDVAMGSLIQSWSGTLAFPDLLQAEIDNWPFKEIDATQFPHGIVIVKITLKTSAASTYALNVENWDDPTTINGVNPTIDAITTSTSTEASEDTITYGTIAAGQIIMLDLPTTDISWITVTIFYYEPAA